MSGEEEIHTYGCKRLQLDEKAERRCRAPKDDGNAGCRKTIDVSPIETLLTGDQKKIQEGCKESIRRAREQGRAALVLGAGISIPMGAPGWTALLSRMAGYALEHQRYEKSPDESANLCPAELERALAEGKIEILAGTNALEAAQYVSNLLEELSSDGKDAVDVLLKSTILNIISKCRRPEELEELKEDGGIEKLLRCNTLVAVANLMRAKNGFRRALTYNYDGLVQECLAELFEIPEERIVTHAEGWSKIPDGIEKPIELLHVHGYLGREEGDERFRKESRRVILSEDSYYDMEQNDAYGWSSSVQSYYLHRDTCVFVGFSAEDYNFRRILRQLGRSDSEEDRPPHYLILTVDDLAKETYANVCQYRLKNGLDPKGVQAEAKALLAQELEMKAAYWARYKFYPIWATVDDVPKILTSLLQPPKT